MGRSWPRRCAPRTLSVEPDLEPHSIRAYFIRRGDHTEPVRYEVDRIRNGRSFATRRVVARQAIGAILNAECSFQRPEPAALVQTDHDARRAGARRPRAVVVDGDVRSASVPPEQVTGGSRDGAGRSVAWMRVNDDLGDPPIRPRADASLLAGLPQRRPAHRRGHPSAPDRRSTRSDTTCSSPASTTRSGSTVRARRSLASVRLRLPPLRRRPRPVDRSRLHRRRRPRGHRRPRGPGPRRSRPHRRTRAELT